MTKILTFKLSAACEDKMQTSRVISEGITVVVQIIDKFFLGVFGKLHNRIYCRQLEIEIKGSDGEQLILIQKK